MQLKSFHDVTPGYQRIYISPHCDDVVYSCSGNIATQVGSGERLLVITVFAGLPSARLKLSPFAQQVHKTMGFCRGLGRGRLSIAQNGRSVMSRRRAEDAAALTYLQADYLWLDYLDCIYRGTPAYYTQMSQLIGGELHPEDAYIDEQLTQNLLAVCERFPETTWYFPLGVGRHLDHQIVSSVARSLMRSGANVTFYEDFPYVLREGRLQARLSELNGIFEPTLVDISGVINQRLKATALYASQVQISFGNKMAMDNVVRQYTKGLLSANERFLERYWIMQ